MRTKLIGMGIALLAGASMFAQPRVSIGIGIGGGYAPRAYAPAYVAQPAIPPCPGPGYSWVDGYWSHDRGRNSWVTGYWQKPRYEQRSYFNGRNSRYNNDTRRDNDRGRDFDRDQYGNSGRSFGNGYRNR